MVSKILAGVAIAAVVVGALGLAPFVPCIALGVVAVAVAILI
jgi:hypothetical protein